MNFEFDMPVTKAFKNDEGYFLEGISATGDIDSDKERFSLAALQQMAEAKDIPLTNSHGANILKGPQLVDEIGILVKSELKDDTFTTQFKMDADDEVGMRVWNKIAKGASAFLSAGGRIASTKPGNFAKGEKRILDSIILEHISIVKKPANQRCTLTGAFRKSMKEFDMEENTEVNLEDNLEDTFTTSASAYFKSLLVTDENTFAKIGKTFSAATVDKLKSIMLAIKGMIDPDEGLEDGVEGAAPIEGIKKVDAIDGAKPEDPIVDEDDKGNIAKEEKPVITESFNKEEIKSFIKEALGEYVKLAKTERTSLIVKEEQTAPETIQEIYAKSTNLRETLSEQLNKAFRK